MNVRTLLSFSLEIVRKIKEVFEGINHKDRELWTHFFTEDACIIPPDFPVDCKGIRVLFVA